ncbi:MAG: hypothetical protein FWE37_06960 [Spirochaetaceae bacterium]|nr:hypothetical protein [Spirochaetaceae bacterium]
MKKLLSIFIMFFMAGCATMDNRARATINTFFAPNAQLYAGLNPSALPLRGARRLTVGSHTDFIFTLLNRTNWAGFYQDSSLNGYLNGSFPKGFIERQLQRDRGWQPINEGDGSWQSRFIEISLPQSNHIFVSTGSVVALSQRQNPPPASFLPGDVVNALTHNALTLYSPQFANLLGLLNFSLPLPIDGGLLLTLSDSDNVAAAINQLFVTTSGRYQLWGFIESPSALNARLLNTLFRTMRLSFNPDSLWHKLENEALGNRVYFYLPLTRGESEQLLATLIDQLAGGFL